MTDAALAARAREGDADALVALYRRYVAEIYAFVQSHVGTAQDSEDITSETFLRVVRSLPDFEGRSTVRTWLYVIARNCLNDHWRRNGRRPIQLDDLGSLREPAEPPSRARREVTVLGRAILDGLPDNYRQVLTLRIIEGRSIRDTANAMSISEGNVKVMQHRALRRAGDLARRLEGGGEEGHAHQAYA